MADEYIKVLEDASGTRNVQTYRNNISGSLVDAEATVLVDTSGVPITEFPITSVVPLAVDATGSTVTLQDAVVEATSSDASTFLAQVSQPDAINLNATVNQGTSNWYIRSINTAVTVNSPNASNFLATVTGPITNTELRASPVSVTGTFFQTLQPVSSPNASNFLATISGTATAIQSNASNLLVTATQSGTWNVGTLTTVTNPVTVAQSNASNFQTTVSGTVSANCNVSQIGGTTVATNSGTLTAGTQRVVLATDQPQLTNKLLVTPDANSAFNLSQIGGTVTATNSGTLTAGTQRVVIATDQPQLTNKLLVTPDANTAFNLAQIAGTAPASSVAGVLDTMPRKKTGSTGLSPTYTSGRINTSTTTQITQATCYLSSLQVSIYTAGTTWALNITDRQAIPLPIVPNFVVGSVLGANNPITLSFAEPIICTSGINVITVGGTPGNMAYFATYWS